MKVKIEESWRLHLQEEFDKPYFERLTAFVRNEYAHAHVHLRAPVSFTFLMSVLLIR